MEPGCPAWKYDQHPNRQGVLQRQVAALLEEFVADACDHTARVRDTRPLHRRLFSELTPEGFPQFAGNYRGEPVRCLRYYEVGVQGDPAVGSPAGRVRMDMAVLSRQIMQSMGALDAGRETPHAVLSPEDRLLTVVAVAALIFQRLLTIHPFADGNGHTARACVWAVLLRYGYWPRQFSIEPRPGLPDYGDAISHHRRGNWEPLEELILGCIVPAR